MFIPISRGMPVNYSKFDHIEDSDDDKPDPAAQSAEAKRKELMEQMKKKIATGDDAEEAPAEEKAPHQSDRFSYGEADCDKLAHELLRACVSKTPSVKVGNGVLSVGKIEKIEGDAQMFTVRGELRHTWDISFKVKFTFQWMGSNFDEGARRAEGAISVCEFTDATTLKAEKTPPIIRKAWVDKGGIDADRQKAVEKALGGKPWPPEEGTLLFGISKALEIFGDELPTQTTRAQRKNKEEREEAAKEEAEEFRQAGGVLIEEVKDS